MDRDPRIRGRRGAAAGTGVLALAAACLVVLGLVLMHEVVDEARSRRTMAGCGDAAGRSAAAIVRPASPGKSAAAPAAKASKPSPPPPLPKKPPPPKPVPPPKPKPAPKAAPKPPPVPHRRLLTLPLAQAVVHVGRLLGRSTALDPQAAKAVSVTLGANGEAVRDAAGLLCKQAGLVAVERGGLLLFTRPETAKTALADDAAWRRVPKPSDAALAARLKQKVTCGFAAQSLPHVLRFLGTLLRVTVVLDPAARHGVPPITVRLQGLPAEQALRRVCQLAGRVYVVYDGALLVTTPERVERLVRGGGAHIRPPAGKAAEQMAKRVSLYFVGTPAPQALSYVASLTDVPFVLAPQALPEPPPALTLAVHDLPLGQALRWVCRAAGLTCAWQDGSILITAPPRAAAAAGPANGA